jgi:hypothetical protein
MKKINSIKYGLSKTFRTHQLFVVLVVLLVIIIAAIYRVIAMNDLSAVQNDINNSSGSVKVIKFNEDAIERIRSLRDNNVSNPGVSIPNDRRNPFNE